MSIPVSPSNGELVKLTEMHRYSDRYAVKNLAGDKEVYAFKGNIFLKSLVTGDVTQMTYTSSVESAPLFLTNGNIAYRVDNKFFEHSLTNNTVKELVSLKLANAPSSVSYTESYLAKEQRELIDYIANSQNERQLKAQESSRLKARNSTITQTEFYLGQGSKIVHAVLSPKGDKMIVATTQSPSGRKDTDIMPNYIFDDGNIVAERVRYRVADNRQYKESLWLLDLKSGIKFPLNYNVLPGFDEDVLADVKRENLAFTGKSYQSRRSPRNIHVMGVEQPIKWQANGNQVAIMLKAWDNKDRWLTTVDLLGNQLINQHRLHDSAWINHQFNEFGWLNKTNELYYLSEETGYSHLYVKSIKGKAKQLTQGDFEVANITVSRDETSFYFKANPEHPGVYEIYRLNRHTTNRAQLTKLTKLNGMTDYQLSPDESKLLLEHSNRVTPPELYIKDLTLNTPAKQLTATVTEQFKQINWIKPEVVAIESSHQEKPVYARVYQAPYNDKQVTPRKAVMFSHGSGYLQNAHLGWSKYFREFMFHTLLVEQGYVVIDMDYRASKGYGRDWRTSIYRHMGKPELEDMIDGVNWLVEHANVDRDRIGTYGGSYGGFLTLMALFNEPEVFQAGAALRLVSDWAYYNHGYTSNILNTPEHDAIAYQRSSPIYFAEGLTKPLLINAPMVDDNVFFQDTVRLVQRLIELEKENFETAIYPVESHGFTEPSSWLDEYRRIFKLFESNL